MKIARTVREQVVGCEIGGRVSSLMIGAPDMAFERKLVFFDYTIKIPQVLDFKINLNLSGRCGVFNRLRTEINLKWLYMSRCWHKSRRQLCDNTSASRILFSRGILSKSELNNLSLINKIFTSSYKSRPVGITYKFKGVIREFSIRTNLKERYNQFERKSDREITVEDRSIERLIAKIRGSDTLLINLYHNPNLLKNLFNRQCLYEIELILKDYNLLVTKIILQFKLMIYRNVFPGSCNPQ